MPLRQHDIILAEGSFQVVLTNRRRLFAVINAPKTALGPMRIALEVDRRAFQEAMRIRREIGDERFMVGGFFDDIGHAFSGVANEVGHAVSHVANDLGHNLGHIASDLGHGLGHAAEGAFNAVSKVATTLARPVFNTVRDVTGTAMHLISQHMPFLPEGARKSLEAASRIVMRARLGDLTAKDFIKGVVSAVKAGVEGARKIGDALLTGSRLVAHVLDFPLRIMEHIPGLKGVAGFMQNLSPFAKFEKMTTLVQKGDFAGLKKMVTDDIHAFQGVVSLFPGLGTAISAALSAGMAILDGGGLLDIAVKTAYGAIPIPPGIRTITDMVLDGVLALIDKGGNLTEAALAAARDAVPDGFPRQVFDTLANLVVRKHPPIQVAGELLDHYVGKFADNVVGGVASNVASKIKVGAELPTHEGDVERVLRSTRFVQPLGRILFEPVATDEPIATSTALVLA
jgi:hypothetical protein